MLPPDYPGDTGSTLGRSWPKLVEMLSPARVAVAIVAATLASSAVQPRLAEA